MGIKNFCNKQCTIHVLKNLAIISFLFFGFFHEGIAQSPVINYPVPKNLPPVTKQKIKPVSNNKNLKISIKDVTSELSAYYSLLNFADQGSKNFESHDPSNLYWELTKWQSNEISDQPGSKNWSKKLLWRKIPETAVYGKWEISLLPFPPDDDIKFTGVIRSGVVETKGTDSLFFILNYTDVEDKKLIIKLDAYNNTGKLIPKNAKVPGIQQQQPQEKSIYKDIKMDSSMLSGFFYNIDEPRKFYIRIVPLDEIKMPLRKISNDIIVQEERNKAWKQPPLALNNDYVITNIKYVPVQFPNINYQNCAIVTGYNEAEIPPNLSQLFKENYPIGATICPTPAKDKAWYEKVFNSPVDFVKTTIEGAANFYNETKNYFKGKFKDFACSAVQGTPETVSDACETLMGAAFDYGMVAVGIPPALPTSEDLTKMAEGQIVELACDKIENETGMPIPEVAREQIRNQVHDYLTQQSGKGTINSGGYVNFKAHPLGQFQTAYLQVEVTRVSKNSSVTGIVNFEVSDYTSRTIKVYDVVKKKSDPLNVNCNLYEQTYGYVPYLENVGDKTTVYIILRPQDSYVHYDEVFPNKIKSIDPFPLTAQDYPLNPTYEGNANTSGFQTLVGEGSMTRFNFGLKKTDAVNVVFSVQ